MKTLALYLFGFLRFIVLVFTIILSVWFFGVAIFALIAAIGGDRADWQYALMQYVYFFGCCIVVGVLDDINYKITKENYDFDSIFLFEVYILLMFAHYNLVKKAFVRGNKDGSAGCSRNG
ncbi:hypothetical protein [Neobacillus mesonae]|uniref:hypothetical protein n=1 Tax=Neobacillus mesonae TaxID=1193713 RepID=UPI0025725808|nr:hypothetical protein [Neobacillus mesonae]MED4203621.1 hypothetical protein [Neobacillus mesonae]